MWDFDKLFAEGNIVGLLYPDGEIVPIPCKFREESNIENLIQYYGNKDLKCEDYKIQYIIRLDEHGNVAERLFDRERDMAKPMPKLETGMFVKTYNMYIDESFLGFIYDNRVIYQNGDWDEVYDLKEDMVMEIYSAEALCFNSCQEPYLLWRNPKYQSN